MAELVFVYGTLKKGQPNYPVMERAKGKFIGHFGTDPEFTMYDLGAYPAVSNGGNTSIKGEIYAVEDIKPLDWLEGYPEFYDRHQIDTHYGPAWIYTYHPDESLPIVINGYWADHVWLDDYD